MRVPFGTLIDEWPAELEFEREGSNPDLQGCTNAARALDAETATVSAISSQFPLFATGGLLDRMGHAQPAHEAMTERDILQSLVPINALSPSHFDELATSTPIEHVKARGKLFSKGDTDGVAVYLLAGEVALKSDGSERVIAAGTDVARYPLAHLKPRQYDGTAKTEVSVARVDSARLDYLLTLDQTSQAGGIEVMEFDGASDGEWMMQMLRNEAFEKLPPTNINAMFGRLEPVDVKAGQVVIRQGDPGDYYYLIKEGRASVSRKVESGKVAVLGELGAGQGFGEEALLSGSPRNATVIMLSAGVLMRLGAKDFNELLKAPLVKTVVLNEARSLAQSGAGLIDVRTEDEFRHGAIKGAINLPLYQLRAKAAGLDPKRRYIAYCDTGKRSTTAAFLLTQRGFDVCVLRGGLASHGPQGA
jgi:CRP-like cAMP-binding protein